jgi:hypothetical protein
VVARSPHGYGPGPWRRELHELGFIPGIKGGVVPQLGIAALNAAVWRQVMFTPARRRSLMAFDGV